MQSDSGDTVLQANSDSALSPMTNLAVNTLMLQSVDTSTRIDLAKAAKTLLNRMRQVSSRAAFVYIIAGSIHAAIIAILLLGSYGTEFSIARLVGVWFILAWPIIPTFTRVAIGNRRLQWLAPIIYISLGVMISALFLGLSFTQYGYLWIIYMALPSLTLFVLDSRRLRAVTPLLTPILFVVLFGLNLGLGTFYFVVNVSETGFSLLVAVVVVIGFVTVGWRFLPRFARQYQNKQTSDQQLTLDTWWLLFTLWECIFLINNMGWLGFMGLLAFAAYRLTVTFGLRNLQPGKANQQPVKLLLLRVFKPDNKVERLLDEIGLHWRYIGSVQLIAGTDLANAYLQPHELLDFVSGKLDRQFIKNQQELEARLQSLDSAPDPDGRYRINDFFCYENTWRITLQHLVGDNDVILMDWTKFCRVYQ